MTDTSNPSVATSSYEPPAAMAAVATATPGLPGPAESAESADSAVSDGASPQGSLQASRPLDTGRQDDRHMTTGLIRVFVFQIPPRRQTHHPRGRSMVTSVRQPI